jgi:RHS repeat-associated protein
MVRDPNNVGTNSVYDNLGRSTQSTDTAGAVTKTAYDKAGNTIKQTDAKNKHTLITFDPRDRQKSSTDRINGATTYAYTPSGQLASLTDAEGQTTAYTYDARGSKLTEQYPDHVAGSTIGTTGYGIVSFIYDNAGRVLRKEDQLGDTVTYLYDLAGRMTARDYRAKVNSPAGTIADTDSFTFDRAGRMLTAVSGRYANTVAYTYDPAGRKSTEALTISGQTYTTTTAYDPTGQVSGLTYPNGTVASRTYTDRGQLATLGFNGTTIDTRTYDNGGRMTASSYNNGVSESRTYNTDNTLTSINFTGAPIGNLTYGWDANKNKTSEGISGPMSGYGFNVGGSGYDSEDRLVNWQRSDNNLTQAWNLSLVGDWNSITENSQTQSRTHGPTHELLNVAGQAVQHDVKGNMMLIPANLRPTTSGTPQPLSMSWDFDNRLVSADTNNDSTADVFYKWDALGRRIYRDDGTIATVYVQSGQQTIADYTAGTAATSPTYTYVYASYIDEPVMRSGSGNLVYLHRNQQYSVSAITDGSGFITERYAYSAYGTPTITDASGTTRTTTAIGNRYTFTGREWDRSLALYHYRARMYDSTCGRFVSRDPIGYVDGQNLYPGYFFLDFTDPEGTLVHPVGVGVVVVATVIVIAGIAVTIWTIDWIATKIKEVLRRVEPPRDTDCNDDPKECPPCPPPPQPETDTTHDHGKCEEKTGSKTHWHYYEYHQDPETCDCYGPYRRFGGCGAAP